MESMEHDAKYANIYIGQTKNNFSKRWNSHRYNWNLMTNNTKINDKRLEDCTNIKKATNNWEMKDKQALYIHYTKFHKSNIEHGLNLSDAYEVFFIQTRYSLLINPSTKNWTYKRTTISENLTLKLTFLKLFYQNTSDFIKKKKKKTTKLI